MTKTRTRLAPGRVTALALAATLLAPLLTAAPAQAHAWGAGTRDVRAITAKQKVVALAGAALLYYHYKKQQAK